jgi:peroxiredoxin
MRAWRVILQYRRWPPDDALSRLKKVRVQLDAYTAEPCAKKGRYNQDVRTRIHPLFRGRFIGPAAVVVAILLSFAGCSKSGGSAEPKNLTSKNERKAAPGFLLKDANGATVNLADYKGKVVLVNFWATWCGPCKVEIPWFIEFQQQYKDRDFTVLGVSMDDDGWKSVTPYVSEHKINYPIVIGNDQVSQLYGGVDSLPTSFIVDRSGRIAATHVGLVDRSDYQNEILKLLEDPKTAAAVAASPVVFADLLKPSLHRPGQRP